MADAYPYIDKQTLDLIKYPPLKSPIVAYGEDKDYSSNNLRGKQFQFCYRYKYDNKMKSVFSPYSEVLIPQGEELPNGDFIPNYQLNNYISVKVFWGHHTVDEIEVAFRAGNDATLYVFDRLRRPDTFEFTGTIYRDSNRMDHIGNWGGLKIEDLRQGMTILCEPTGMYNPNGLHIVRIDLNEQCIYLSGNPVGVFPIPEFNLTTGAKIDTYTFSIFRNDKVNYAVPNDERDESFDFVPLKSGCMEVVESNRIIVGDNTTGFPNVDTNMDLSLTNIPDATYVLKSTILKSYMNDVSGVREVIIRIPDSLIDGDYLYMNFDFVSRLDGLAHLKSMGYFYQSSSGDTPEEIATYFITSLNTINNLSDVLTDPTVDYNFKARTLLQDNTEYHINTYNNSTAYAKGSLVRYNSGVYIAKKNTSAVTPANTANWELVCPVTEMDRVMIVRALPLGSDGTFYNYFLEVYGASTYTSKGIHNCFKYGHKQNVAIEYLDYAGRSGSAQKDEGSEIYVPHMNELYSEFQYNNEYNTLTLRVKHRPPDWAYKYRILLDRNVPEFQQFFFKGPKNANPDIIDDNIHVKINVNRAILNLRDSFPKSILSPYIFQKGDRIRILSYQDTLASTYFLNAWKNYSTVIDSEIIGYDYPSTEESYMKDDSDNHDYILDDTGNKIRKESTGRIIVEKGSFNLDTIASAVYVLYEIYRPRKVSDENTSYWETHKTFDIINPTSEERCHQGDTDQAPFVDEVSPTPATITLSMGNVYRKMRYSGDADVYFPVESLHASDYYISDSISIGRANVISSDLGQIREENVCIYSDKLYEGTGTNRINKFPISNRLDKLQSKHGRIVAFKGKGYILYAYQERKVTSIYVGMTSIINPADGSDDMKILANSVFGTVRPQEQEFGCINPESITTSFNHVFFWDGINGKWCRTAYNGVFPVSDYGANKLFTDLNEASKLSGLRKALSVWDNKHDELIVSHRYFEHADYNLSVIGDYVLGDYKMTGIGRKGGALITSIQEGMVLSGLSTSEDIENTNASLIILKVDVENKIIYFDQPILFPIESLGPWEIMGTILKKINLQTLSFHEGVNGWKSGYSFNPDFAITFGDELLMFINGRTYICNSDNVPYNNFFGIQYESFIKFPWNVEPSVVKLLDGIEYIATDRWGIIEKGDITVKSFDNRGMDMESKLPAAKFKNVEGKFVSELLRDMNDPSFTNKNYALVSGRFLRGQACIIKLTTFETTKTVLHEVALYFTPSL